MVVRMTAEYLAVGSMLTGGALEYWGIRTPPASTNCLTGLPAAGVVDPPLDGGGNVGATTDVGGAVVGAGLGVSNTQAARPMAARKEEIRNFSFIRERIT